jgi:hypothetical protein
MNMRVWCVLLILWVSGWGSAQGSALLGGQASCGVNATPAPVMTGSSSFDMLTFAPDAQCWFNETVVTLASSGVFHAVDGLAAAVMTVLFVTTVLIPFITDPKSRGARMIISAITYVVFGSITISAARNQPGNAIDVIRGYMFTGWTSIYVPSANRGSALINASSGSGSVSANLQGIANKVAQLNYDATIFSRRQKEVMAIAVSAQATNASSTDTAAQVDALIKSDQQQYGDPSAGPGTWTNIGFFLLLGVFAVFAAIVYSTGLGVIIASLMLSIAFAFAAAGNFSGLKTTLNTTLAAFISTLVVPFTVSIVIAIAFGQPTAAMLRNLTSDSAAVHQSLLNFVTQYQGSVEACDPTNFLTCGVNNQLAGIGAAISGAWESLRTQMVGMLTIVIGMIVSLGIGLSQLRRVPALVGSMLGVSGGGESSGTGANPLGTVAEALGVVAAGRALSKNMIAKGAKGAGKGGKTSSAEGGGSGATETGAGDGGGGGVGGSTPGNSGGLPRATPPATAAKGGGNPMTASQKVGMAIAGIPTAAGIAQGAANNVKAAASRAGNAVSSAASTVKGAPAAAVANVKDAAASVVTAVTGARTDVAMGAAARTQRANAARGGTASTSGTTGAAGTSAAGNGDAAKTIDAAGYISPKGTSGGTENSGTGNGSGKSGTQQGSAQGVPKAPNDVVERPKATPAGTARPAAPAASASPPAASAPSGPSAPGNTGAYGGPQNRPAPAPATTSSPTAAANVPLSSNVNSPQIGATPPTPPATPTRVMTNPGGGMAKTNAGASKDVPGITNTGPTGASGLNPGKSGATPAPAVTAQNAYSAPKNTSGPAQGGSGVGQGAWKTAQSPAAPAANPTPAAPAVSARASGTPAARPAAPPSTPPSGPGSLPPEPDFTPTPPRPTPTQPRFSSRMDARRKTP